jgi:hypothetical protein
MGVKSGRVDMAKIREIIGRNMASRVLGDLLPEIKQTQLLHVGRDYDLDLIFHTWACQFTGRNDANVFGWAALENGNCTGVIVLQSSPAKNKRGESTILWNEMFWVSFSSDKTVGGRLFLTALKAAKRRGVTLFSMSSIFSNPEHQKVTKFYEKLGFEKDSVTYTKEL